MTSSLIRSSTRAATFRRAGAALAATAVLAAGCSTDSGSGADSEQSQVTIRIGAAASLSDVLPQLIEKFNETNPDVQVEFEPAGSPTLVSQLIGGAPYNLVMLASEASLEPATKAGVVTGEAIFARNVPQIAVPADNPAHIDGLDDFAGEDVRVALCEVEVPCGAAAKKVIDADGVQFEPVTRENDVTAVLTRVRTGEVDAGIVYRTDVASARGDVLGIDVPDAEAATTSYPVAQSTADDGDEAANSAAGRFQEFLLTPEAQDILAKSGFLAPEGN
ncbi:MAG TPA: molybdate ABC transporter substrate-binding protein [Dietzia timorensis]|uniref:Molybdate ABC transporter substrate-binding protein n=1 Tax=Dietzia timorensis TaxID=499555 RepID=A0A921JXB8_9ACTN|nr:molybdate ABC transporter substrate-binding protein [Dietzia timorensis]HJE89822.1 molybdate ABC transporter substrate-binding protein [Dietzia timorensis]